MTRIDRVTQMHKLIGVVVGIGQWQAALTVKTVDVFTRNVEVDHTRIQFIDFYAFGIVVLGL